MSNQISMLRPTGEVRPPKTGEWYRCTGEYGEGWTEAHRAVMPPDTIKLATSDAPEDVHRAIYVPVPEHQVLLEFAGIEALTDIDRSARYPNREVS